MSEKFSAEKLAALKSIGHLKSGRTKHTSAGSIQASVEEIRTDEDFIRETKDINGSVITEHKDGRQDVDVHPEPLQVIKETIS